MVLLHLTKTDIPYEVTEKSDLVNCCAALNCGPETGRRWDFLNKPKKDTKQIAQKDACLLQERFKRDLIPIKIVVVIGNLALAGVP